MELLQKACVISAKASGLADRQVGIHNKINKKSSP